MYPVSEKFLKAISKDNRSYYYSGAIVTKDGERYTFSNKDIVKGSGCINRQVCGSGEIELGSVYASELSLSLFLDIDRYTLFDAAVYLYFNLLVEDGSIESIPMGIYEVAEANRSLKTLEIKAYDYMLRFDKPLDLSSSSGTAYEFIASACTSCKVEMAQSKEEMAAMANGEETLGIFEENDIESWRDLIYYVAQALAAVAMINREGKLVLVSYGTDPVYTIDIKERFSSSYSDFETRYTALSSTNRMKEISEYYALEVDDGLTMNLGTNPLLQYGVETTRKRVLTAILEKITSFAYVPFDSTTIGNPALDPMDILIFKGGQADESKLSCITSISYRINGKQTLKCVGKNPKLQNSKSKNDKNFTGLLNQVDATKTVVYQFMNVSPFEIGETPLKVISISFTSKDRTSAMFLGEILLDINAFNTEKKLQGKANYLDEEEKEVQKEVSYTFVDRTKPVLTVSYKLNDNLIETFIPKETLHEGKKILTLYYPMDSVKENTVNTFDVYLSIVDGLARIDEMNALASIMGQGLVADYSKWDGNIKISQTFKDISYLWAEVLFDKFKENITVETKDVPSYSLASSIPDILYTSSQVRFDSFNERINFEEVIKSFTMDADYPGEMNKAFIKIVDGVFSLAKEYRFNSFEDEINFGTLKKVEITTDTLKSVQSIEVANDT